MGGPHRAIWPTRGTPGGRESGRGPAGNQARRLTEGRGQARWLGYRRWRERCLGSRQAVMNVGANTRRDDCSSLGHARRGNRHSLEAACGRQQADESCHVGQAAEEQRRGRRRDGEPHGLHDVGQPDVPSALSPDPIGRFGLAVRKGQLAHSRFAVARSSRDLRAMNSPGPDGPHDARGGAGSRAKE
jgi:hypothetical protein